MALLVANPLDDPNAYSKAKIAGVENPGIARLISGGSRPYKWDVKDSAGSDGGTTTYRGFKNSEHIQIRYEFWTAAQISEFFANYYPLLRYDAQKKDPKPIQIEFPQLKANDIVSVVTNEIGPLMDLGAQLWSVTVEFIEFVPPKKKNVTTTPKGAPKSSDKSNQPSVEDLLDADNAKLEQQWRRALPKRRS